MSQFYHQKKELAARLFIELAAQMPQDYWDWNKLAERAGDAVDAFDQVFEKRYGGHPQDASLSAIALAAISGASPSADSWPLL